MESIRSLEKVSHKALYEAFREAFKDYEMQLSESGLFKMLQRRGYHPELSFGAFSGEKLVAFTFNGIGQFNGQATAYDTGTGTMEEYRGKGLASRVFDYSIPYLRGAGISQYLLEVLLHNEKAVSLYKRLGFEISREFNYYIEDMDKLHLKADVPVPDYKIETIDPPKKEEVRTFWDHSPSWQNSFDAVDRSPEDFLSLGAFQDNKLLGYCIFEPESGDITQLAIEKQFRKKGIASLLLHTACRSNKADSVKAINYQTDLQGFDTLMKSMGITCMGKQYEMIKQL